MHPQFQKSDSLTGGIIASAIEVHRETGPGLIESIYERCFLHELALRQMRATNQRIVRVQYKNLVFEEPLRFDVLVENCVLVELKAVAQVLPIHKAQLMTYMKLLNVPIGLLINFHEMKLVDGVHRFILPGANG
jgi:GxxExxY protein